MSAVHWTDETDAEAAVFFDTLTERKIRRRQNLCVVQIGIAFEQRNENALTDLQRMQDSLAHAMLRRIPA